MGKILISAVESGECQIELFKKKTKTYPVATAFLSAFFYFLLSFFSFFHPSLLSILLLVPCVLLKCIAIYPSGATTVLVLPRYGGRGRGGRGEERLLKAKAKIQLHRVTALHEHGYPGNGCSAATAECCAVLFSWLGLSYYYCYYLCWDTQGLIGMLS